jgi:hypothetical protein
MGRRARETGDLDQRLDVRIGAGEPAGAVVDALADLLISVADDEQVRPENAAASAAN